MRWSSDEHIPEQLARAFLATIEIDMFANPRAMALLGKSTPWLGRAKAEDLYLSSSDYPSFDRFNAQIGLELLGGFRHIDHRPKPVRVERTPGRNEPCPCGSGKKFKKCCVAA